MRLGILLLYMLNVLADFIIIAHCIAFSILTLASSILTGTTGVRISRACLTIPLASSAWAFRRLWNTCRTILLWMANLAMMWASRR